MALLWSAMVQGKAALSRAASAARPWADRLRGRAPRTSISDDAGYPRVCERAATDPQFFRNFKVEPAYNEILEHVTFEQGQAYLARALERSPALAERFDRFRENDRLGNPRTFDYGPHGVFSPTTLRYVKVLSDLERLVGDLDDKRVVEIGVGYGGQCKVIADRFAFARYTLVDLPPVLALARAYLGKLGVERFEARTADELDAGASYDLVISNYAFSECTRAVQLDYLARVLKASRAGYLTCNVIAPESFRSMTAGELVAALPGARVAPEDPLTYPGNYVVTWGGAS